MVPSRIHGTFLVVVMILGPLFILLMLIRGNFKMLFGALQFFGFKKKKNARSLGTTQEIEDMVSSYDKTRTVEESHGRKTEMQTFGESPNQRTAATGVVDKVAPFLIKSPQLQEQPAVGFEKDTESDNRTHARNRAKSLDEDPMFLSEEPLTAQSLPEFVIIESLYEQAFVRLDNFHAEMRHIHGTSLDEENETKLINEEMKKANSRSSTPLNAAESRSSSSDARKSRSSTPLNAAGPRSSSSDEARKSRSSTPLDAPGSRSSSSAEARKSQGSTPLNAAGSCSLSSDEARKSRSSTPLDAPGSRSSSSVEARSQRASRETLLI
jgi:hypothetical protein